MAMADRSDHHRLGFFRVRSFGSGMWSEPASSQSYSGRNGGALGLASCSSAIPMRSILPLLVLLVPSVANGAVHAARVPEGKAVVIDGRLDDEAWLDAPVVDDFVGIRPTEGFEPSGSTTVRVLFDDQKLYFAWDCRFDEPTRVRGYFADREQINRDDQIAILIDPFGDGRRAYHFWLNALGVQQDLVVTLEGSYNFAWDTVFHSEGRITDTGYTVEVAIPFRSLRFDPTSHKPWRILLKRKFTAKDEYVAFPAIKRDNGNELLQYDELVMDPPKTSGVGIELLPSVVGRTGWDRDGEDLTHRPFTFPGAVDPSFGFKWQPTPALTLDATLNPDFSQVEADPNQVDNNLRFALFLPEQRPFFLEGAELYESHLLYTRSIRDPIYGVKFSGKAGPVGIGILHALDETPASSFVGERETPGFTDEALDGTLAFNTMGGAKIDIGRRNRLSVYYADKEVVRPVEGEPAEHVAVYRGGHASLRLGVGDVTTVNLDAGVSHAGAADGDRLTGGRFAIKVERSTRTTGFGADAGLITPDYRTEMGFLTTPDRARIGGWARKRLEPRRGPVQWLVLNAAIRSLLEGLEGTAKPSSALAEASANARLPGLTDFRVATALRDTLFGGQRFHGATASFSLSNSALEAFTASVHGSFGDAIRFGDATDSVRGHVGGRINLRLFRRLQIELGADLDRLGREGEVINQLVLYRARTVIGFTRWLSLRFIAQGRTSTVFDIAGEAETPSHALAMSALVRIEPAPGSAILLGWGQQFATDDVRFRTQSIDLFAKASVLIRL